MRWFTIGISNPCQIKADKSDPISQNLDLTIDLDSDSIDTGMDTNWKKLQRTLGPSGAGRVQKKRTAKIQKSRRADGDGTRDGLPIIQAVNVGQHRVNILRKEDSSKSVFHGLTAAKLLKFKDADLKKLTTSDLKESLDFEAEQKEEGNYVALDCEFVGIRDGSVNALARISVVNYYGHVLLDEFIRPTERVVDWRTAVSGVRPRNVKHSRTKKELMPDLLVLLHGKKIVGHALGNDFKVLGYNPPTKLVLDTALNTQYRNLMNSRTPSLKRLCEQVLSLDIQEGEHSSVEDAQAAMCLYRLNKSNFRC